MKSLISKIRSGGQSGVDRGALDAARAAVTPITGWCPAGGWAEDLPEPPGLLVAYPELRPTPLTDVNQRTEWNVRDSHATLIVLHPQGQESKGTDFTVACAKEYGRPHLVMKDESIDDVVQWLHTVGSGLTLNVGGPRESESPGAYLRTLHVIGEILGASAQR